MLPGELWPPAGAATRTKGKRACTRRRKAVSMATQRADAPRTLPSAQRRPSCSTAGWTTAASSLSSSTPSTVTCCSMKTRGVSSGSSHNHECWGSQGNHAWCCDHLTWQPISAQAGARDAVQRPLCQASQAREDMHPVLLQVREQLCRLRAGRRGVLPTPPLRSRRLGSPPRHSSHRLSLAHPPLLSRERFRPPRRRICQRVADCCGCGGIAAGGPQAGCLAALALVALPRRAALATFTSLQNRFSTANSKCRPSSKTHGPSCDVCQVSTRNKDASRQALVSPSSQSKPPSSFSYM